MSKTEKLQNGKISASEVYTLLKKLGWFLDRQNGSHQTWANGKQTLTLSPHGNELKGYQIKQIQQKLEEK